MKAAVALFSIYVVFSTHILSQTNRPGTRANADLETIRLRAEQGDAEAQNELGMMYVRGEGVNKQLFEASRWFRKAAEQGNARGQYHLALYWLNGERVNRAEAVLWYKKAAEQGLSDAQNELGLKYDKGVDVPQSLDEALKWFQRAAELGHASAKSNLVAALKRKNAKNAESESAQIRKSTHSTTTQITHPADASTDMPSVQNQRADLVTKSGTVYKSFRVESYNPVEISISYTPEGGGMGMANVRFEDLPDDLRQRYSFDAQKASEFETAQTEGKKQLTKVFEQMWLAEKEGKEKLAQAQAEAEAEEVRIKAEQAREAERVRIAKAMAEARAEEERRRADEIYWQTRQAVEDQLNYRRRGYR